MVLCCFYLFFGNFKQCILIIFTPQFLQSPSYPPTSQLHVIFFPLFNSPQLPCLLFTHSRTWGSPLEHSPPTRGQATKENRLSSSGRDQLAAAPQAVLAASPLRAGMLNASALHPLLPAHECAGPDPEDTVLLGPPNLWLLQSFLSFPAGP